MEGDAVTRARANVTSSGCSGSVCESYIGNFLIAVDIYRLVGQFGPISLLKVALILGSLPPIMAHLSLH